MRVFVTGATGFIGSAIVRDLRAAGHDVLGLARTDESAVLLATTGATVHRGALDDLDSLAKGASLCDGVIHTAFIHDFKDHAAAGATDLRAVKAMGAALAGSGKPFVNTSGTAVNTPGILGIEDVAANAQSNGNMRIASEEAVLAMANDGVRSSVMRLPPSVHGEGDHGFVPMLIARARTTGASAYIGDGDNRWPSVHRVDVARLYRLALESAPAGTRLHGVAEEGVRTRDIASVIARRLNLPLKSVTPEEAGDQFGFLARFWGIDNPTSSALTRQRFGWSPVEPGLLEDLDHPYYYL